MTLITISIIAATAIYSVYIAICLALFGIPKSLSDTYYLWKARNGRGWYFSLMMYSVVALMMPAWITMSEGSDFQFLAFLAPAAIAFVATAPAFKSDDLENKVHTYSAIMAAACSLLWVALVTPYWVAIPIYVVFEGAMAFFSKTYKTCLVYWLEKVAFEAIFTSALLFSLK